MKLALLGLLLAAGVLAWRRRHRVGWEPDYGMADPYVVGWRW